MVVHDLNVLSTYSRPAEANPELIVNTDAILPGAIALERFEPIARRHPEILEPSCDLQLPKLASRD
jgi:hypothetical protein